MLKQEAGYEHLVYKLITSSFIIVFYYTRSSSLEHAEKFF